MDYFCVLCILICNIAFIQAFPSAFRSNDNTILVGDYETERNQFPYQAGLNSFLADGNQIFCSGSLISPWFILTAAHCTNNVEEMEIILGAHRIHDHTECTQIRLNSTEFMTHEHWTPETLQNDLALVKLPKRVKLNRYVNAIRLTANDNVNYENLNAIVNSWEQNDLTGISPVLKYVKKTNTDQEDNKEACQVIHSSILLPKIHTETKSISFHGISGGALVIEEENGDFVQIGIISYGHKLCNIYPVVLTHINNKHMNWIQQKIDSI